MSFDRNTATSAQVATVDALVAAKGDKAAAATALGISRDALGKRLKTLGMTVDQVLALGAPKRAPKAAQTRYVRDNGPVAVIDGPSRLIRVGTDHPAAAAIEIVKEMGGTAKATPTGLRLNDESGREFAIVAATKQRANFYLPCVSVEKAKEIAGDLGSWDFCWPLKKTGCAVLIDVERVTKTLVRTLMKLSATHSVDRRTKEFRANAA